MRGGNSHKGVQVVSSIPPKKIRGLHACMGLQGGGVHPPPPIEFSHTAPSLPACFFLSTPVKGDVDF